MRWTEIKYKCSCMTAETSIQVPERGKAEDIRDFMNRVQLAIGKDHRERSPLCLATKMEYAKVPVEGDVIGGAVGGTA